MNVLLTTSAAPQVSVFDTNEKRFPLGVGFLISVLEQAGHKVHFVDRYLAPTDFIGNGFLEKHGIECVGIYSNTVCFRDTIGLCSELQGLRERGQWKGIIVVGGPHASICPETIPDYVDFVVRGEGEKAVLDIVEGRAKGRVQCGAHIDTLDVLPMPAYHHFVGKPYMLAAGAYADDLVDSPIFSMNTSRGCPFGCTFCSVKAVWGKTYRAFSAARVVEDIEKLHSDYQIKGVFFREDHFTHSSERTAEFCELLLRKNLRTKWLCEARVHPLDLALLPLMKRAGCEMIFFGCESGSDRILKQIRKGITAQHIRQAILACNKLGIRTFTTWLAGVPGETRADRKATLQLIEEINPFKVAVGVFVGLPGSELRQEMENRKEILVEDDLGLAYSKRHNRLVFHHYGVSSHKFIHSDGVIGKAPPFYRAVAPAYSFLRKARYRTVRLAQHILRES